MNQEQPLALKRSVGIITADAGLAKQTGLPFLPPERSVLHGGIRVTLYSTGVLA